VPLDMFLLAPG